jgi:hypothetical protein
VRTGKSVVSLIRTRFGGRGRAKVCRSETSNFERGGNLSKRRSECRNRLTAVFDILMMKMARRWI